MKSEMKRERRSDGMNTDRMRACVEKRETGQSKKKKKNRTRFTFTGHIQIELTHVKCIRFSGRIRLLQWLTMHSYI